MAETLSLMEFLQALMGDAELRSAFAHDPQGTLVEHGLADLSPADVHDAIVLVQDTQTVDFALGTAAYPPPPPIEDAGPEEAVAYLGRYLGQDTTSASQAWDDVDPDADLAAPPVPPDAGGPHTPSGPTDPSFGAGEVDPATTPDHAWEPVDVWGDSWPEPDRGGGHAFDVDPPMVDDLADEPGDDLDDVDDAADHGPADGRHPLGGDA
jgi:hypothetical protein